MFKRINLDNITIVLHQPRHPENIGSVARAMCNMGFSRLVVIDPPDYDLNKIQKLATHAASDVVDKTIIYADLKNALSHFNYVVGATARLGGQRQVVNTPSKLAQKLVPISIENRIAILFGPEDRGLSNDDIRYCHGLVNIPTSEFSSLNLAQAVMITCYEIFIAGLEKNTGFTPRLASRHELDGMYDQLKDILVRISYINPENPDYWINKLRRFFSRIQLRAKEVSIIRGICRQIDWYGKKCYGDGQGTRQNQATGEHKEY
ncbi:MAG: RNA methyltransferase [Deltaproteobacteria bacterium]|nr:RNA methyltransferase [Deltaproteobacteria bacterium]